jgi:arylsulfatase A-like enzyme
LIRAHDPQKPFYLHLTYQAVHNPCEEPPLSQQIPNASVPGEWWDQTWGSMLNALDQGIANVTTALRAKDMWKNTLLVLVSDNGGDDLVSPSDPTGRTTMANNYPYRGTGGKVPRVPRYGRCAADATVNNQLRSGPRYPG